MAWSNLANLFCGSSYIQTVGGLRDLYPPTLRDLYPFTGPLGSLTLGSFHLVTLRDLYPFTGPLGSLTLGSFHLVTLRDLYPFTGPLGSLTLGSFHLVTLRDLYPFTGPLGSLTLGSFHLVSGKDLKWRRGGGGRAVVGETTRPSSLPSLKNDKAKIYCWKKWSQKKVITKYIAVLIIQSTVKTVHSTQQHVQKDLKLSN